ncbi:hypothetical protein E2C01_059560 [Portunus trituberculatus]|uniref:Uncharacterized protein n=1 Tax=Portunus trituberculatus TaxID=210409 RepID=A0A5B7H712_PORTR|nr:hypothetical protein [Portunus trituberculatus]
MSRDSVVPQDAVSRSRSAARNLLTTISDQQRTPDSTDEGIGREERSTTGQKGNGRGNEGDDLHEAHVTDHNVATESRNRTRSSSMQLGVMRPGGQAREYDLIPGFFLTRKPPIRVASRDTLGRWTKDIRSAGIDLNISPHSTTKRFREFESTFF